MKYHMGIDSDTLTSDDLQNLNYNMKSSNHNQYEYYKYRHLVKQMLIFGTIAMVLITVAVVILSSCCNRENNAKYFPIVDVDHSNLNHYGSVV